MSDQPTPPSSAPPNTSDTVPYSRFQEVVRERSEALEKLKAAEAKAAQYDQVNSTLEKERAEWSAQKTRWETDSKLSAFGLTDPEGREVAQFLFGRIPESTRPKDITFWIEGFKAEGAEVPLSLQPYLKGMQPQPGQSPPQNRTLPKPPGGNQQAPSGQGELSPDQIKQIAAEANRTGNWTTFKQLVLKQKN